MKQGVGLSGGPRRGNALRRARVYGLRRRRAAVLCICSVYLLAVGGPARGAVYLPPPGKVYAGVSGGVPTTYELQTHTHAAVFEEYVTWGGSVNWAINIANKNRSRMMLHISTITPSGGEVISPGDIARGRGDAYLLSLASYLAARGQPTYVRIMAEMNGYWEPYCAFNKNGRPRDRAHSTRAFRQAWRRIVLILRGGPLQSVDHQLARLRMPPVQGTTAPLLPHAPVAFIWTPQTSGDPQISANGPWPYFPGRRFVDWIGTDFYSKFPNWPGLNGFWRAYTREAPGKPFMFGEWGMWGADHPAFVKEFLAWVRTHRSVRMLLYFQGYKPHGPFDLGRYPKSKSVISRMLRTPLFAPFAPEWLTPPPPPAL